MFERVKSSFQVLLSKGARQKFDNPVNILKIKLYQKIVDLGCQDDKL